MTHPARRRWAVTAPLVVLGLAAGCANGRPRAAPPAPTPPPAVALASLQSMRWAALPADPLGPRELAITAWTGSAFLAVGGDPVKGQGPALTGADAYDPQARTWSRLPDFPLEPRSAPASTWTGAGLVIWGGETDPGGERALTHALGDGAILDMTTRRWRVLPPGPLPALNEPVAVTDAQDRVIIMGGEPDRPAASGGGLPVASRLVASYDPFNRAWRRLPDLPSVPGHDVIAVTAVRWGSRILAAQTWEHVTHPVPGATSGNAGVDLFLLDAAESRWSAFPLRPAAPLIGADLQPLGTSLAIGGGSFCSPFSACPVMPRSAFAVVDGGGRARAGVAAPPIELRAETAIGDLYVVMTGSQITGGGYDEQPGDTAAFDLAANRWVALPSARRFKPEPESLTWTGHELIAASPTGFIALAAAGH